MRSYLLLLLLLTTAIVNAQENEASTIRAILDHQAAYWNQGNLEKFMEGYWHNDSLLFVGKNGPTYGYKQTLDNYRRNYPDTKAMGKLHFEGIHLKKLSPDYYFVLGNWFLQRQIGDIHGSFTLLIRKIGGHWQIIIDHSS